MSTTGDRIKERRKALGMSVEELAVKLGKNRATVYRYESNEIEKLPTTVLEPLALALDTTPAYLMGWHHESGGRDAPLPARPKIPPPEKPVPIIGKIAAGTPILAEENIEGYVTLEGRVKADFALRVHGDSMINVPIYDGDIVFIKQQPDVDDGDIAAVVVDDEATLKRVYKHRGFVELRPENNNYKAMIYSEGDGVDLRIVGKAVGFLHNFE